MPIFRTRMSFAFLAVILFPPFVAFAQGTAPAPSSTLPLEQLYKMPAVYSVRGMDKVEIHRDIVYTTVNTAQGEVDLKLDVYLPPNVKPGQQFPYVLLISGGGIEGAPYDWRDAGVYQSYGRILAASGFVGVTYSKRYARGAAGVKQGIEDTHAVVGFLNKHAREFHIRFSRSAFWAFSAGGPVLSITLRQFRPATAATVCFYCVTDVDVEGLPEAAANRMLLDTSPLYNLRHRGGAHTPPLFIARAGLDSSYINDKLDQFIQEAIKQNLDLEVMNHPTGHHAFDTLDNNERSGEIIRRALAFLKARLN